MLTVVLILMNHGAHLQRHAQLLINVVLLMVMSGVFMEIMTLLMTSALDMVNPVVITHKTNSVLRKENKFANLNAAQHQTIGVHMLKTASLMKDVVHTDQTDMFV